MTDKKPSRKVQAMKEPLLRFKKKLREIVQNDFKNIIDPAERERFLATIKPFIEEIVGAGLEADGARVNVRVDPKDPSRALISFDKLKRYVVRYDKSFSVAVDAYSVEEAIKKAETEPEDVWDSETGEMEAELENGEE